MGLTYGLRCSDMNYRLLAKYLGLVALLLGFSMVLSLPWAWPFEGGSAKFEGRAFGALVGSVGLSVFLGAVLYWIGRRASGQLYRKEAMATVGLSWIMATILGATPFLLSKTYRAPDTPMTVVDALFESASGITGTGATVITNLEDPQQVPRSILFWRSETHFLGGLGIMVLFVAILGHGSAGKALLLAELPGPSRETGWSRTQHSAWVFTIIYLGLNLVLTSALVLEGMSVFDSLCHSFGTIATGGFSTYNDSVSHFHSVTIEMTIAVFMVLACTNFALLYLLLLRQPGKLLGDVEFRTYMVILAVATLTVMGFAVHYGDFENLAQAFRHSFFQVASILTNTGFATHDFNEWNEFGRGILFLLMYVGGCAGSTSCSMKVIRHILFAKILWLEIERAWHPTVVRPLQVGGKSIDAPDIRTTVLVYFGLILVISVISWLALDMIEPDTAWSMRGHGRHEKLIDCASGVAATLNGVGPGLGTIGAVENYSHFQPLSKLLFVSLMMLGRLEVYTVLVLFIPRFWRSR